MRTVKPVHDLGLARAFEVMVHPNLFLRSGRFLKELNEDDRAHITSLFNEDMVPKLKKLNARLGTLNCEFAGERYRHWNLRFRSIGSDFSIEEFEYDEDGMGIDLDV
jgi:hypothetical protein